MPAEAEDDHWLHVALHDHLDQLEAAGDTLYASLPAPPLGWGSFILEQEHGFLKIIFSEVALHKCGCEEQVKVCYDYLLHQSGGAHGASPKGTVSTSRAFMGNPRWSQ